MKANTGGAPWTTAATTDHASSIAMRKTNTRHSQRRPRPTAVLRLRLGIAGQVGSQRGELVEVDGPVRPDDALVELLDGQPALAEVLAEQLDDLLTVLVARSHPGLEFPHRMCLLEVRHPMMRRSRRRWRGAERRPEQTFSSTPAP